MRCRVLPLVVCMLSGMLSGATARATDPADLPPGIYRPRLVIDEMRCITADDRERAERAANPQAFSSDVGIYLPPLYWASRDRTFEQIALMYWKNLDVEDNTRFDLLFPLFARLCAPENDTFVGPFALTGWRTDELGTAGYVGPYFFRRDADAETDTLFPIFWWVRDAGGSTLVAGPLFDVDTPDLHVYGLAPLWLGIEQRDGFFEASPLHLRFGDDQQQSGTFALQTFWSFGPSDDWSVLSVPFYWGGHDESGDRDWHVVPPLLFGAWSTADTNGVVAGPYLSFENPGAKDRGLFPVFAMGEGTSARDSAIASLLLDEHASDFHYHVVPPLLYGHVGSEDGDVERTWFLQSFLARSDKGWDAGSLPFYFGGRSRYGALEYDVVPPLLFARWFEDGERTWLIGPWLDVHNDDGGHDNALLPLALWGTIDDDGDAAWPSRRLLWLLRGALGDGRTPRHHLLIPPLLFAHVGDDDHTRTYALQSYLWTGPSGWDAGSLPFYLGGRETQRDDGLSYDVIPPLLFARWSEDGYNGIWFAQTLGGWRDDAEDWWFLSLPLAFGFGDTKASFALAPPLLFLHAAGPRHSITHLGPAWLWTGPSGWDAGVFPLYVGGRETQDPDNGLAYDFSLPLLFARWSEDDRHRLWLAQTFASWSAERWSVTSLPFFFGAHEPDGREHYVVPLAFASWNDPLKEDRGLQIGPFMDLQKPSGHEQSLLPLFLESHAREGGGEWGVGLASLFRFTLQRALGRDGSSLDDLHVRLVPPLLYAHVGDNEIERTWFLQSYLMRSPHAWDAGSLPFYLGGRADDVDYAYDLIPPLLFARVQDKSKWWFASVPFVFGGGDATNDSHHFLIPPLLLAIWGDAQHETVVAGPWIDIDANAGHDRALLPLYFSGEARHVDNEWGAWLSRAVRPALQIAMGRDASSTKPLHHRVVPPLLYGHVGDRDSGVERTWFAQSFLARSRVGWDAGSLPFYFGGRETQRDDGLSYDIVPPLLFARWGERGQESLWLAQTLASWSAQGWWLASLPLVLSFGDATQQRSWTHVASGWLWTSPTGFDFGALPFYAGGRTNSGSFAYDLVPPLLFARWTENDATTVWLAQTFGSWDSRGWWFASLPLVLSFGDNSQQRSWTHVLSGWLWTSPAGWDFGALPFYVGGRTASGSYEYDVIPPLLFGRLHDGDDNSIWALQTFAHWSEREWSISSLPLLFAGRDEHGEHLIVPPLLFGAWGDGTNSSLIAGPIMNFERDNGASFDRALLPLFVEGELSSTSAGPIASTFGLRTGLSRALDSEPDADLHYRLIPFLYAHAGDGVTEQTLVAQSWLRRSPWGVDVGSFPLYLGGWTTYAEAPNSHYHVIPPLLFATWTNGRGTHDVIAGPVWWTGRPDGWSAWAAPFYFGADGDRRRPWYHIVPPLLFGAWGDDFMGRSTVVQFPFYLHSEDRRGYVDAKTPLWWTWGNAQGDQRTLFLPLLMYGSRVDDEDFLIAPLVYRRANPSSSDFVVFPFWWDFKGKDLDATIVSGLWWDFHWKDDGERLQIAPGYLRWDDREETLTIAGPITWSSSKTNDAWSFHVFPVYSSWSFHKEHIKWRVLFGALGYEREREVEQWMILWLKTRPS